MKFENTNKNDRFSKEDLLLKGKHSYIGKVSCAPGLKIGFFTVYDELGNSIKSSIIEPEQMNLLLPGDIINGIIETYENPQTNDLTTVAVVDSIIETKFHKFCGIFVVENEAHYVIPDFYGYNKKIRIPNSFVNDAKMDDYVECEVIVHPFNSNGKAKAKVTYVIGHSKHPGIETDYISRKNGIRTSFPFETIKEVDTINGSIIQDKKNNSNSNYLDMTDKTFVSIDGNNTIDVDDAICIEQNENFHKIHIAIADVGSFVTRGCQIDNEAMKRSSSVYYLGKLIPMLPTKLSTDLCSLKAGVDRLVLVCSVSVNNNGEILAYSFNQAVINSKAKLTYSEVEDYVFHCSNDFKYSDEVKLVIKNLYEVYNILSARRKTNNLIHDFGRDFKTLLDPTGTFIKDIVPQEKNVTMNMVEECMVLANMLAGRFIYKHYADNGIYRINNGLRLDDMESLLNVLQKEVDSKITEVMLKSLDGFKSIIKRVENSSYETSRDEEVSKPVSDRTRQLIRNNFDSSSFSKQGFGHLGMGLERYTFFTSPIRRYPDLVVHRMIKAVLNKESIVDSEISDDELSIINNAIKNINKSTKELETWLKGDYLDSKYEGEHIVGKILSIEKSGVRIILDSNGIVGNFAFTRFNKEKYNIKLDLQNYSFTINNEIINLSDKVSVVFDKYDFFTKKIMFKDLQPFKEDVK
jgi:ribonuclease R